MPASRVVRLREVLLLRHRERLLRQNFRILSRWMQQKQECDQTSRRHFTSSTRSAIPFPSVQHKRVRRCAAELLDPTGRPVPTMLSIFSAAPRPK